MHKSFKFIAVPMTLAFAAGALANDSPTANSAAASSAVEALKASLKGETGFEVNKVHVTDDGTACIKYSVAGDKSQETHAQAVVEGDKVLRSTSRSKEFANAWNNKCAGKKTASN